MAQDVFLSYSSKDSATSTAIRSALAKRHIRCLDTHAGGLSQAIKFMPPQRQIMVLIFSSHAETSSRIHREAEIAVEIGAAIVAYRLEDITPHESWGAILDDAQWLDAFTPPVERHEEELMKCVLELIYPVPARKIGSSEDAREVLRQIISTYGTPVAADMQRLEGLLRDLCGTQKRENGLLLNAAREGVPTALLSQAAARQPPELLLARQASHLEENLFISPNVARWAVESWAIALGFIAPSNLTTHELNFNPGTVMVKPEDSPRIDDAEVADEQVVTPLHEDSVPDLEDSAPDLEDIQQTSDPAAAGWNWSAFFLGWVWLFGHKLWRWGWISFIACCIISVFSQEYNGLLHDRDALAAWEDTTGEAITHHVNGLLHTNFLPWHLGVPIAEYLVVLLSFLPIGIFSNKMIQVPGKGSVERFWKWFGVAALILGPLSFVVVNRFLVWLLYVLFPT